MSPYILPPLAHGYLGEIWGRIARLACFAAARLPIALTLFLLGAALPDISAAANLDATWHGGAGTWNDGANWSGGIVPNNTPPNTFSVLIDGGNAVSSEVVLDISRTISNLTIDGGDRLHQNSGTSLSVVSGTVRNNGTLSLNSIGPTTDLRCFGGTTLSGTGNIQLMGSPNNRIVTDNTVCVHAAGHTIRGAGQVLASSGGMQNSGTIIADQTAALRIDPNSLDFTNTGTLQAQNGGTLRLEAGIFTNTGGLIQALDASTVIIDDAVVAGGVITTSGSGTISTSGGSFSGVTNNGAVVHESGQAGRITGTLTNNGTWLLSSSGTMTDLRCFGAATLAGPGSITMSNNANNRIVTDNTVCTHAASHTIHGAGQLLANSGGMLNAGTIIADQTAGLTIDPNTLNFTNTGKMQARSGATLRLSPGTFTNTNGIIEALDASKISVDGATVIGGTITTAGSGVISVGGRSTFTGVTSTAMVEQINGQTSSITGTLINNGTWSLLSTGGSTELWCVDGAALSGSGSIAMGNNANNRIVTNTSVCKNAAGHTIRGAGQLLANSGGLLNQGTIIADQTTPLKIDPNASGFVNQGMLRAMGSGGIQIGSDVFTTSGTVVVDAGSALSRNGVYAQTAGITTVHGTLNATGLADIQGGVLQGAGTVAANVSNAGQVFPGTSTSPGVLTIGGSYTQTAAGGLTIEIGGPTVGTEFDRLAVNGAATLSGTIHIVLTNGYRPPLGTAFTVLKFSSHTGDFATYDGLTQSNGVFFSKTLTLAGLVLTVTDVTPTPDPTPTSTDTTPSATATVTPTPTAVVTATVTPPIPTLTPTSTVTPTPFGCVGDCDGNGQVTVDELVKGVNIALDNAALSTCARSDVDGSGTVTVDEVIVGVNNALSDCR